METIHLKINPGVYDRVIALLQQFNPKDVQIVSEEYLTAKAELDETLKLIESKDMKLYSVSEFED
ncbi:tRNA pseudouridine synthase A [Flavobacterium salilacus subsp. salilacus]|uniref:tRNA pseudouridine synthase A n=1 Tax=Flavobacterium TaxID=237 RepID=UPI001075640F|nr:MULTISPECIES: tRNA pseudouridine synthase A [Flavobacterium]KAF2519674.1 tRNA pseudouridine synthase A [Flavobacterium salilacus subsp. salilacus]MBE1614439.1 tRNA pseudouridine synthase A [Flavobacterium sp. SaA2.13]